MDSYHTFEPTSALFGVFRDVYKRPKLVDTVQTVAVLIALKVTMTIIYRLYFHPLCKFPGPKLAAATHLYEFWYQGVKRAVFYKKINELHRKYGPIVRINPGEISINDSDFNVDHFAKDRSHAKDPWYYRLGSTNSLFTQNNRDEHRRRQKHIHAHLSGKGLVVAAPIVSDELGALQKTLQDCADSGNAVNFSTAYRRMGNDIVRRLVFGESGESNAPADYMRGGEVRHEAILKTLAYVRHFPILWDLHNLLPDWSLHGWLPLAKNRRDAISHVRKLILDSYHDNNSSKDGDGVLYQFVEKDSSYRRNGASIAAEETLELIWGGRETLGHCLTNLTYRVISNPTCKARLQAELQSAPFDLKTATYAQLQTMPYLQAVCKESMRIQLGGYNRLPRIDSNPVAYKNFVIPPKTPISMCPNFYHNDPAYFTDPLCFRPERWLADDSAKLDRYFKPFGNGGLSCIGRYLAMEVVFQTAAQVFGAWKLEFDGIDDEFMWKDGMLEVFPPSDSHGLRVTVEKLQ